MRIASADEDGEEQRREAGAERKVVDMGHGLVIRTLARAALNAGEGRDDPLGVRAQRLRVLERAAGGPQRHAGPARQHMEMQVEHLLAAGDLVELLQR